MNICEGKFVTKNLLYLICVLNLVVLSALLYYFIMAKNGQINPDICLLMDDQEWIDFKAKYKKVYSKEEDAMRIKLYCQTKAFVEEQNAKNEAEGSSVRLGINHFADWTEEEHNKSKNHVMANFAKKQAEKKEPAL